MQSFPAQYMNTSVGIADNAEHGGDATERPAAHRHKVRRAGSSLQTAME